MDEELFELCKEVYERQPKWWDAPRVFDLENGEFTGYTRNNEGMAQIAEWLFKPDPITKRPAAFVPLYTSDYILEKLPHALAGNDLIMDYGYMRGHESVRFAYGKRDKYINANDKVTAGFGNTPLKALLNLVLELDNANQLPHEEKE